MVVRQIVIDAGDKLRSLVEAALCVSDRAVVARSPVVAGIVRRGLAIAAVLETEGGSRDLAPTLIGMQRYGVLWPAIQLLRPFVDMAKESGIADMKRFGVCASDTVRVAAIERDTTEIARLKGLGTPTVVINGWILRAGVTQQRVDSLAAAVLHS